MLKTSDAAASLTTGATSGARGRWLVLIAAFLGWMFDGLEMGIFPLVARPALQDMMRSEEHTSELQSRLHLVCRLLLEKKKKKQTHDVPGARSLILRSLRPDMTCHY